MVCGREETREQARGYTGFFDNHISLSSSRSFAPSRLRDRISSISRVRKCLKMSGFEKRASARPASQIVSENFRRFPVLNVFVWAVQRPLLQRRFFQRHGADVTAAAIAALLAFPEGVELLEHRIDQG